MATSEQAPNTQNSAIEIERKFLVPHFPEVLGDYAVTRVVQGYAAIEEGGTEVRLRSKDDRHHTLTIKTKGELVRGEHETHIDPEQFDTLWPATEGRRIVKDRYAIPYDGHTIELDAYGGSLAGLTVAEVEFGTIEEAEAFTPPEWFGEDVTALKALKNQSLAVHGVPEGLEA